MKRRQPFYLFLAFIAVICGIFSIFAFGNSSNTAVAKQNSSESSKTVAKTTNSTKTTVTATSNKKKQPVIDWQKPSEDKPYPDLAQVNDFWVKVDLKKNRTYLMSGNKVIYRMYSSGGTYYRNKDTGKWESYTPTGTFYIEPERGASFYNAGLSEGANNWISWKDHGVYLFHSVPTYANGNYIVSEAEKLGKMPASHGCIRLSVPDSKWMSENLKTGTKVVIIG